MKKRHIKTLMAFLIIILGMQASPVYAASPRPVYIIAERCNEKGDVKLACDKGANAVEIDCRVRGDGSWVLNKDAYYYPSQELEDFFKNEAVDPRLCLIFLDVKDPKKLGGLCEDVHEYMDKYKTNAYIIYSVSTDKYAKNFDQISNMLRSNEGVCMDYEQDINAVGSWYTGFGIENCWYGYGVEKEQFEKIYNPPKVLQKAMEYRREYGVFKKIENWTLSSENIIKERLIDIGVDAVVVESSNGIKYAVDIVNENSGKIRLATHDDNPFENESLEKGTILSGGNIWIIVAVVVIICVAVVLIYKMKRRNVS